MDSSRPILPAELEFFNKGTGKGKSSWQDIFWLLVLTNPKFLWWQYSQNLMVK